MEREKNAGTTWTEYRLDALRIQVFPDRAALGSQAAEDCAGEIRAALSRQERCRIIFAAAPSQNEILAGLVAAPGIDWARVEAFHMDEYAGLPDLAPQRFGAFLKSRIFSLLPFGRVEYLAPRRLSSSGEFAAEAARYAAILAEAPIDIVCLGIGENGHIAFNDPQVADFHDPLAVKEVLLDEDCRRQQVRDGCFPDLTSVPLRALSLTVPTLLAGGRLFCAVPGSAKAAAVRRTLLGPIDPTCPASALRRHAACALYLDRDSFSEVNPN
jgi:glucosamine-6-phosphate deaminase